MTDVLVLITTDKSQPIVAPLLRAFQRKGADVAVFITGSGSKLLEDRETTSLLSQCNEAIVCSESWQQGNHAEVCPVTLGSQTDNSRLMGEVMRVVSL